MNIHQNKTLERISFSLKDEKWVEEKTTTPKILSPEEVQKLVKENHAEYTLWTTHITFQSTPLRVDILRDIITQL